MYLSFTNNRGVLPMKRSNNARFRNSNALLLAAISGTLVRIDPKSISDDQRTLHHGEFEGVKVNSPATCQIGNSVIFWPDSRKSTAVSTSEAGFGLTAKNFLESKGYTVTKNTA
jgi:hypothetical protein